MTSKNTLGIFPRWQVKITEGIISFVHSVQKLSLFLPYGSFFLVLISLCLLLRWGALDAEAYAEPAMDILKILWEVGTSKPTDPPSLWAKARSSAFLALSKFEV